MYVDDLVRVFRSAVSADAIIWNDRAHSYQWLDQALTRWLAYLDAQAVVAGTVVSLEADFSPDAIALMLALVERGCIVVPLSASVRTQKQEFCDIAEVQAAIEMRENGEVVFTRSARAAMHPILRGLRESGHPGLVLFSSGSTGKSKAAVHDFVPLLEKFKVPRHALRTITFLLFDHIGGLNTLLYNLSNGGCVVTVAERTPDTVCAAIERHRVQLLPTSPTFINLLLVSEVFKRYDLSSLETVTYGTEVMPQSTLERFHELFPKVRLLQTYGLSEVGILRSKSRSSDSLWVKIGGEGFETRVVDGMLEIKAKSAMLGYLNSPSPFTDDGWFKTGDAVEVDGEYVRILGRKSEMINVGGEKLYPAEVESVLQRMEGVEDVAVIAELSPITGQMVVARVKLATDEPVAEFRRRMWEYCRDRLARYKIPQKVVLVGQQMHGERFKKMRRLS
jgi:acyl-coenzyme A synthetase/AMP-(fatty) acid ligase